jgi:hypothetical protein
MNPPYERNLQRDAKLLAGAHVGGQQGFFKVASSMGLWSSPQHAADYFLELKKQDPAYCKKVGAMASQMAALAS